MLWKNKLSLSEYHAYLLKLQMNRQPKLIKPMMPSSK